MDTVAGSRLGRGGRIEITTIVPGPRGGREAELDALEEEERRCQQSRLFFLGHYYMLGG